MPATADGELERALAIGHGRGRHQAQTNGKSSARRMVVDSRRGMAGVDVGVNHGGDSEHGQDGDGDFVCHLERE